MKATLRLMQESGVAGPVETVELPEGNWRTQADAVRAWAAGQAGHPWDVAVVEPEGGEAYEVELS
jgi:hypothetical protein